MIDPCSDNYVTAYLNRRDVQEAMHANVTKVKYEWSPCSDVITKWVDSTSTVIPLLQEFLTRGLRVWIFRFIFLHLFPIYSLLEKYTSWLYNKTVESYLSGCYIIRKKWLSSAC